MLVLYPFECCIIERRNAKDLYGVLYSVSAPSVIEATHEEFSNIIRERAPSPECTNQLVPSVGDLWCMEQRCIERS